VAVFSPNPGAAKNANLTIQCDNPFLPASIAAACAPNNITSFQYGTANADLPGNINVHPTRTQHRVVVGAEGKFAWPAATGPTTPTPSTAEQDRHHVYDISLNARYVAAIDAVRGAEWRDRLPQHRWRRLPAACR
jgi:iron complex outermembrane receptor protein